MRLFQRYGWHCVALWLLLSIVSTSYGEDLIKLSQQETLKIAVKIWFNESARSVMGLTSWNDGEDFASVGIGHFIWYPSRNKYSNSGSFPQLIKYMQARSVPMPTWLQAEVPSCLWHNRQQFREALYSPIMQELRQFLITTIPWQADFMVYRLNKAFNHILASVSPKEQVYLRKQIRKIAASPQGVYALVDYVNFKGDGVGYVDRRGRGWGLLQVLEHMKYALDSMSPLEAFAWSADKVLTRRVENARPYKNEDRWLAGWRKRVWSYTNPMV